MAIAQPQSTDKLNSPDHAKQHRVIASDTAADDQSLTVDDSSNVSVANNLSTGSFTTPYAQTLTVAESGGDYATVTAALATISDASATKRYLVQIAAGEYTENIAAKAYVDLVGMGSLRATLITASVTSNPVITCAGSSAIKNMTLKGATTSAAIKMTAAGAVTTHDISIEDCQYGLWCDHADGRIYSTFLGVEAAPTTCDAVLYSTAGQVIASSIVTTSSSTVTSYAFANGGIIKVWGLAPQVTATNGLYVDNGGSLNAFSCILPQCTYAIRIGNTGTGSMITGGMINSTADNTWDLYCTSATGVIRLMSVGLRVDKVFHEDGSSVRYFGYDSETEKLSIHMNMDIGTHHHPYGLSIGAGGDYQSDCVMKNYDGADYTDLDINGTVAFTDTDPGSMVYLGNDSPSKFYGFKFTMVTSLVIGTGSMVQEYWDAGAAAWVEYNLFSHLQGYSDSYANNPWMQPPGSNLAIEFDNHMISGITENNASATGWAATTIDGVEAYWLRLRIVTSPTTTPAITNVSLRGNNLNIRNNGTSSFHGEARPLKIYTFPLGEITGTASSQDIVISTNITLALAENEFVNGQTDAMFARFIIPDDLDTSSGISFKDLLSTDVAPSGADQTAILHLTYAKVKAEGELGDGSATEYTQAETITFTDGDSAWKSQIVTFAERIDISDLEAEDSVYFKVERLNTEVGDDLAGDIAVTSSWLEYNQWQNGANYST